MAKRIKRIINQIKKEEKKEKENIKGVKKISKISTSNKRNIKETTKKGIEKQKIEPPKGWKPHSKEDPKSSEELKKECLIKSITNKRKATKKIQRRKK